MGRGKQLRFKVRRDGSAGEAAQGGHPGEKKSAPYTEAQKWEDRSYFWAGHSGEPPQRQDGAVVTFPLILREVGRFPRPDGWHSTKCFLAGSVGSAAQLAWVPGSSLGQGLHQHHKESLFIKLWDNSLPRGMLSCLAVWD